MAWRDHWHLLWIAFAVYILHFSNNLVLSFFANTMTLSLATPWSMIALHKSFHGWKTFPTCNWHREVAFFPRWIGPWLASCPSSSLDMLARAWCRKKVDKESRHWSAKTMMWYIFIFQMLKKKTRWAYWWAYWWTKEIERAYWWAKYKALHDSPKAVHTKDRLSRHSSEVLWLGAWMEFLPF